jgi:hypothetical protein
MSARCLATVALIGLASICWIELCSAADPPATQPASQPSVAQQALDRELPEINFQGVPAKDVFEFLHDISQVTLDVDWDALQGAGAPWDAPITLKSAGKPFSKVIDEVLRQLNATEPLASKADGDVIRISTKKALDGRR